MYNPYYIDDDEQTILPYPLVITVFPTGPGLAFGNDISLKILNSDCQPVCLSDEPVGMPETCTFHEPGYF